MRIANVSLVAVMLGVSAIGCGGAHDDDAIGSASVAITKVPDDVTCVRLVAVGSRTVKHDYPVATGSGTVLKLTGLPSGATAFTGFAYQTNTTHTPSCDGVTDSTAPNWLSDAVTATVTTGAPVNVTLKMRRNGEGDVTLDFGEEGDPTVDAGTDPSETGSPADTGSASPDSGSAPDTAAGDTAADGATTAAVRFVSPATGSYVRGKVTIQVAVTGTADSIDLLADGLPLTTLASVTPFELDTTTLPEGAHTLVARAHFGGTSVDSSTLVINVDRTRPTIVSHTPANGATNVLVSAPISVTFSEPIDASSLNGDTAKLVDGSGKSIPTKRSVSADGRTLTIQPTVPTDGPSDFSLTLAPAVTDRAGNTLDADTLTASWNAPQWLFVDGPAFAPIPLDFSNAQAVQTTTYMSAQLGAQKSFWDLTVSGPLFTTDVEQLYYGSGTSFSSVPILPLGTPLAGETAFSGGYSLDDTDSLLDYQYFRSTDAGGANHFRNVINQWSGTAWVQQPATTDKTQIVDSSGKGWYSEQSGTTRNWYRHEASGWVPVATETLPDKYRVMGWQIDPSGSLVVVEYSNVATLVGPRNIRLRRFDVSASAWTSVIEQPSPVDPTARNVSLNVAFDSSAKPYVAFSYAPAPVSGVAQPSHAYVLVPGVGNWQILGGTPVGGASFVNTQDDFPMISWDRFGRLGISTTSALAAPSYVVWSGSTWLAPVTPPVSPLVSGDVGGATFASDAAVPVSFAEWHSVADAAKKNLVTTARMIRLNR